MENLIIKDVSKYYKKNKALDNISLNLKPGIYGLLGENGAGKTTLIRTLATVLNIEHGEILYKNINFKHKEKIVPLIGYLPQKFSAYPKLTVYEFLEYIAILKKIKNKKIDEEIKIVISQTQLEEYEKIKIESLSGGTLRRLGIAQAILGNPEILIIDEPTVGLDPEKRVEFRNMLNTLIKNKIVIISTHIIEDIEATCKNICIIKNGKKLYYGSIEEILKTCEGKIMEKTFNPKDYELIKDKIKLIKFKYVNEDINVRFINKKEYKIQANTVKPCLEDAYIYLMETNGLYT